MTHLTMVTVSVPMAVVNRGSVMGISTLVDPLVVTFARFLESVVVAVGSLVRLDISPSVVLTPAPATVSMSVSTMVTAMSITVSMAVSVSMISSHSDGSKSEDENDGDRLHFDEILN